MLLRLACLTVTNMFAALRLLPMGDRDRDVEILALRHQIIVLERQLGAGTRVRFAPEDRALLAALLTSLPPRGSAPPAASHPAGHRPAPAPRSDGAASCPHLPAEAAWSPAHGPLHPRSRRAPGSGEPRLGYRRIHGELTTLGIKVAPSTVWEIIKQEGVDPAPERASSTWGDFLRSQADALLACDFIETVTLSGQRQDTLAVIEHATRRVRVLGTTAHPSASWVMQAFKNLEDAGCRARFLIRDRDGKFPAPMDEILAEAGIQTVPTGIRMPRMNSIMERWVQSCRYEIPDRCLLWNEHHLRHALREYERFYNQHCAHQAPDQAAPLRPVPDPITHPERIIDLNIRRHDRLGGILHEHSHAA